MGSALPGGQGFWDPGIWDPAGHHCDAGAKVVFRIEWVGSPGMRLQRLALVCSFGDIYEHLMLQVLLCWI